MPIDFLYNLWYNIYVVCKNNNYRRLEELNMFKNNSLQYSYSYLSAGYYYQDSISVAKNSN